MAHVLVIDDDVVIRKLLTDMLENAGHEVHCASDGKSGLQSYQESSFDLVVTDIVMPDYSGINLITDLLQIDPDAKIIAISGGGMIDAARYLSIAEMIGAQHILYKPFSTQELLTAVNDLLNSQP